MNRDFVLAEDVRAFQVIPNWLEPEILIAFYGGPGNACGSIKYSYATFSEVIEAETIALAWLSEQTPLRVVEDSVGVRSIRPMANA